MAHFLYILYSTKADRYYVGESVDPVERSGQHNQHLYKSSATAIATDWAVQVSVSCDDRSHARRIEKWTKSQKSRATIKKMIQEEAYREYQVGRFRNPS